MRITKKTECINKSPTNFHVTWLQTTVLKYFHIETIRNVNRGSIYGNIYEVDIIGIAMVVDTFISERGWI